jgi:hypothetical protein
VPRTRRRGPVAPETRMSFDPIAHAHDPVHLNFSHPTSPSPTADGQSRSETMPIWRPLVGPGPVPSAPTPRGRPVVERVNCTRSRALGDHGRWERQPVSRMAQASGRHRNRHTCKLRRNSADARTSAKMSDRSHVRVYSSRLLHKMMRPPRLAASGRSGNDTSVIEPPRVPLYSSPIPGCRRP